MRHEPIELPARGDSLAGDFGLILEAVADAFRGLSSSSFRAGPQSECSCTKIHYAAWR